MKASEVFDTPEATGFNRVTPDKRVEEIVKEFEKLLSNKEWGAIEKNYIYTTLTQHHQDMMSEVGEKLEGMEPGIKWMQEGFNKKRKGYTDGYNQALTEAQNIIKSK